MSERAWIPTADVRIGDLLAHKLSDTGWAYTRVTGWSDRYLATSGVTHRIFAVAGAPWWVDENSRTADLAGEALVATCGSLPAPEPDYTTHRCQHCGTAIHFAEDVWLDGTDGEGCTDDSGQDGTHAPEPPPEPEPVTRVILGDDWYGYRMPVPSSFSNDFMASDADKWAVLESIGINRPPGWETPLVAWRDTVADESGIPRAQLDPSRGGVLDMGFTPAYARTFVSYLA